MPVGKQSQHRAVINQRDRPQPRVTQRHDRGRARIVGVGLVDACRVQQPHPRRQRRWNIQDGLAERDQLLGPQCAEPGGLLDRPRSRRKTRRERQQTIALMTISPNLNLELTRLGGHLNAGKQRFAGEESLCLSESSRAVSAGVSC